MGFPDRLVQEGTMRFGAQMPVRLLAHERVLISLESCSYKVVKSRCYSSPEDSHSESIFERLFDGKEATSMIDEK